jgi:hypothetical protein
MLEGMDPQLVDVCQSWDSHPSIVGKVNLEINYGHTATFQAGRHSKVLHNGYYVILTTSPEEWHQVIGNDFLNDLAKINWGVSYIAKKTGPRGLVVYELDIRRGATHTVINDIKITASWRLEDG